MSTGSRSQTNIRSLRVDSSGLRRRNIPSTNNDFDDDSKEYAYLQIKDDGLPKVHCIFYVIAWFATLITAIFYLQHDLCRFDKKFVDIKCNTRGPDFLYTPVLVNDHLSKELRVNRRTKRETTNALIAGQFDHYKGSNVHISAVVYSEIYSNRIGEIGHPLNALFYEESIDSITIVDDSLHPKSAKLWQHELLFSDKPPSEQLNAQNLDNQQLKQKYLKWDSVHKTKASSKSFLRTSKIGKGKSFQMGATLNGNSDFLLFLDSWHQLPFDDEWIKNAMALFSQYPNLQILGGFSGVIGGGQTFGDVNVGDMRSNQMDEKQKVFVMSRRSDYYSQQVLDKRKHEESRLNILDFLDSAKEEWFDKYWKQIREKYAANNTNEEEAVGLFSENFVDDFDGAVFVNGDEEKVQTGLEGIHFLAKKRFLNFYEKEIEKRLPISAKRLKKIAEKRRECEQKQQRGKDDDEICERLKLNKGQRTSNYHFIPYEQRIGNDEWIPFMFVTAVQMGPIFVRSEWWSDVLQPHLDRMNEKMFDIELCLWTWTLGGQVGLFDAEGFKFDRVGFEKGLRRNEQGDDEWNAFEKGHHLARAEDWNVWNVSHLVELNEGEKNSKLRLRTSVKESSQNPEHPTAIQNSRQMMLTMQAFEEAFDKNVKRKNKQKMLRLQNNKKSEKGNPLN